MKILSSETFKKAVNQIDDALTPIDDMTLHQLREKIKDIENVMKNNL